MIRPSLEIIPASAGSGKTFTLTQTLLEKVQQGEVSLENLVAVTFTEAGATELKSRIRAKLLSEGLYEEARQVDEAYISTIHSFGNRMLRELAFDLGLPLNTRMLNEDEQTQLIRASMIDSESLIEMSERLEEFGYKTRMIGKKFIGPDGEFRKQLTNFIDLLRSTGRQNSEQEFLQRSVQWLAKQYGEVETNQTELELATVMHKAVCALLDKHPTCPLELMEITSKAGIEGFQASYRALEKASRFTPLLNEWSLWASLENLSVKGRKKPKSSHQLEFVALANAVRDTAASLLAKHPGPLRHATEHLKGLIEGAGETLQGYGRRKNESKLVDFTDMVATAELALRQSIARDRLSDRIQLLVVDEFQDTNPIQFAFLWHLIGSGVNSVLVGDSKQSIMGFQGADPRLFNELIRSELAKTRSLDSNWRSQPRLLKIINALTSGLCQSCGMDMQYTELTPNGKSSALEPLHLLVIEDKPPRNSNKEHEGHQDENTVESDSESAGELKRHPSEKSWHARLMAELIQRKLNSGLQVVDRRTGKPRPIRGSDVALLCPTNSMMSVYASELECLGLPVNMERPAWYESSEVILAIELLKLLYNSDDLHARLIVACSDLGRMSLQDALKHVLEGSKIQIPVLEAIKKLRVEAINLNVPDIVELMLERTELLDQASTWQGCEQARANILKLLGLAREFSSAQPETLRSAGFYGRGIGTFLGWLKHVMAQGVDTACPRASYHDENAIELTTWHKSKGREWPVVVVCGLEKPPKVTLPHAQIGYESFADFSALIQKSHIQFTPRYDCEQKREQLAIELRSGAEQVALRELYVAISRPREQLVLEWPSAHLKESANQKIQKRIQLIARLANIEIGDQVVKINGQEFEASIDRASYSWQDPPSANSLIDFSATTTCGRAAIDWSEPNHKSRVKAQINPSLLAGQTEEFGITESNSSAIKVESYGLEIDLGFQNKADELGTLIHRLIELVMTGRHEVGSYRRRIELALAKHIDARTISQLWDQAVRLKMHLLQMDEDVCLNSEVPVLGSLDGKTVVVGTMDLVVQGRNIRMIVDHKSGAVVGDHSELWKKYAPQLNVYCLMSPGFKGAISSVRSGQLSVASVE